MSSDQVVDSLTMLERALPEPMHLHLTGYRTGSRTDRVFRNGFDVPLGVPLPVPVPFIRF